MTPSTRNGLHTICQLFVADPIGYDFSVHCQYLLLISDTDSLHLAAEMFDIALHYIAVSCYCLCTLGIFHGSILLIYSVDDRN